MTAFSTAKCLYEKKTPNRSSLLVCLIIGMGLEEVKIKYSSNVEAADKSKIKEILNAICGILNNPKDGGKLILFSEIPYTKKNLDDITRKIEQKLQETFGLPATREIIDKIP